jgi:hypothetical protein
VSGPGADDGRRTIAVTVDGVPRTVESGRTVAGILLAGGETAWRPDGMGGLRGVFCGIGVCFDCLVTIGDERDVRACQRVAADGDTIVTGPVRS